MDSKIKNARIAGFLYLLIIGFGLIAQVFVRDHLVDYRDAGITAKNIIASEFWFRFGFVSELLMLVCDIGVTTILFFLFKNFSGGLSLLSTLFRLASIIILSITALSHYAALFFLGKPPYLSVFNPSQLQALALLSIQVHGSGYNISLLFFGIHLVILGYMIVGSGALPKTPGILLLAAGLCYDLNSLVWFLFPAFVPFIYPAILIPCFAGELFFSIWLLWKGVKIDGKNPAA